MGLRQYVLGEKMCKQIAIWWSSLKGLPSLPVDLVRKVPAIYLSSAGASGTRGVYKMPRISVISALDMDRRAVQGAVVQMEHHRASHYGPC
ncbi:hypothetical protein ANCCAN_17125 [Ancylostoma caninum]|uniref:Uncharacterized protein n=1 Tax=Ancylostoma caninum TaxID=29170 RepID=A0A368G320_ANCCA|nr:hypothetical protein ANCCAN_17125 [Ancylostoma caninum]